MKMDDLLTSEETEAIRQIDRSRGIDFLIYRLSLLIPTFLIVFFGVAVGSLLLVFVGLATYTGFAIRDVREDMRQLRIIKSITRKYREERIANKAPGA